MPKVNIWKLESGYVEINAPEGQEPTVKVIAIEPEQQLRKATIGIMDFWGIAKEFAEKCKARNPQYEAELDAIINAINKAKLGG